MRRKIALYIADQLVDLDEQTFILFNYTMEDMSNPAIVRNSFSQSVTLKGTPNNNKIFGGIWRSDRETIGGGTTGAYFDPTKKTSFTIYNELNEILESGYCKLDGISRKGVNVEYKVSLFGGLGAFFYALSYDEKGNKRTLADLKFSGENAQETELDFRITKESVLSAWKRLNGDKSQSSLWDIINFAPAYNGLPSGQFDAGKAIINAANAGLSVPDGYMTTGGFVVATLPMEYTEWETKDLRSYLQRPVIKMKSIIDSICKAYNNGGYEVELDDEFFSSANPYYNDTYLTLPIINTLSIASEKHEEDLIFDLTFDDTINLPAETGGNPSTEYILKIRIKPRLSLDEYSDYDLYMHCTQSLIQNGEVYRITRTNYITYTAIAYDAEGVELKRERVSVGTNENQGASFNYLGFFTPDGEWSGDDVEFNFQGYGISYIRILQEIDSFWSSIEGGADIVEPTPTPMLVWGKAKWENSIGVKEYAKYLATLLDSDSLNSAGEYELKHSSEYLHADDYSYLAYNYWPVYMSLVTANPNILKYSFWVDLPEGHFISAYEVFRKHRVQGFDNWTNLFQVVLYRSHLIDELRMGYFAESVPNLSWEVMEYLNHSVSYKLDPLLKRYCSGKISEVLLWLRQQNNLTMPAARFVVENITPSDEIVKGLGSAGWIALYDCNKYENLSYFTFMFILGHNWNDELGLKFIKRSFDQLHQVLAADSCPRYIWERIEPYTAKLRWYNEWDKCKKLRKGIVRYLKLSGYNKDVLPYLTTNKNLNETLESIWEMV